MLASTIFITKVLTSDVSPILHHKIQDLIDARYISKTKKLDQPNIITNPLPNHQNQNVNFLSLGEDPCIDVCTLIIPTSKLYSPHTTMARPACRYDMIPSGGMEGERMSE